MESFPENLYKWLGNQISKGGDAAGSAIIMVERDLKTTTSFMNERGLLHFDAHFGNIVTNGHRLYFADFGLALCSRFELSKAECEFFELHQNYDKCSTVTNLLHCIITNSFGKNKWEADLRDYIDGKKGELISSLSLIIKRYAPIAFKMDEFYKELRNESKSTPYPAQELERLCIIAGL